MLITSFHFFVVSLLWSSKSLQNPRVVILGVICADHLPSNFVVPLMWVTKTLQNPRVVILDPDLDPICGDPSFQISLSL